ncbi:hypothetical protein [Ruegeria conchae]|uniref:hypothetical protein n=1 Tax=Ruegeria conchae TaxID=981384 RepID=UPI00023796B8|nr:hypothetical protein [Ruegeria conchae]
MPPVIPAQETGVEFGQFINSPNQIEMAFTFEQYARDKAGLGVDPSCHYSGELRRGADRISHANTVAPTTQKMF